MGGEVGAVDRVAGLKLFEVVSGLEGMHKAADLKLFEVAGWLEAA